MHRVVLVAVVGAALAASNCSEESRPTSPTVADPITFAGVWEGRARILSCGGSMCDPRTCANILGRFEPNGDQRDIRIVYIQGDGSVTAELNTNRASAVSSVVPLQGTVRGPIAVMEGQLTTGTPPNHAVRSVSDFVATIAAREG